ncbi:DMT family transporter [Nocardiopsis valliformis]|uniref:DMT family transporter n=1 Tax=Nocardiopsis valliformis TaxID=239974 RepID=UPI000344B2D2|nr:DMT family transporter [Nocardiopsis valliformis]
MGVSGMLRFGVVGLMWGSSMFWIMLALQGLSTVQFSFGRIVIAAATLSVALAVCGVALPRGSRVWGHLLVLAFLSHLLPVILLEIGDATGSDSGLVSVFNASVPLCVVVLLVLGGRARGLGARLPLGLVVGFAGVLLLFAPWEAGAGRLLTWGVLISVVGAVFYGLSMLYMEWLMKRGLLTPLALAAGQALLGAGWIGLALPLGGIEVPQLSLTVVLGVTVTGVLNTGLVYWLFVSLVRDEGSTMASSVMYVVPIVLILLSTVILGQEVSGREWAGMLVILFGLCLAWWPSRTGRPAERRDSAPVPV